MTDLEGCIRYWEAKRKEYHLMEPGTIAQIEFTIKFLKELKEIKDGRGKEANNTP